MISYAGEPTIGRSTLRRLAEAWPQRAAVRQPLAEPIDGYDPQRPDYPIELVPFAEHPRFLAAAPDLRDHVLSGLWLGYNERVVATEHLIANPAFDLIMSGRLPGSDSDLIRQAVQQAVIDESYHTYLHQMAIRRTRRLRGLSDRPEQPVLVTYRRLRDTLATCTEQWERDIATLVWGAVAETCINALLALIARDRAVQPMHSLITRLHLRDESAHGSVVIEVMREMYRHMNAEQRAAVTRFIPLALQAFSVQDPLVLRTELAHAGIDGVDEIIGELPRGNRELVRDYSGVRHMVDELELTDAIDFDFPDPPEWPTTISQDLADLPLEPVGA